MTKWLKLGSRVSAEKYFLKFSHSKFGDEIWMKSIWSGWKDEAQAMAEWLVLDFAAERYIILGNGER